MKPQAKICRSEPTTMALVNAQPETATRRCSSSQNKETKENPAKGGVSRLLIGRDSLFPLREETLLTNQLCFAIGTVPLSANT